MMLGLGPVCRVLDVCIGEYFWINIYYLLGLSISLLLAMEIFITKMNLSTLSLLFILILGSHYINAKETSDGTSQKEKKRDPKCN